MASLLKTLVRAYQRWRKVETPQLIDREYIEDETAEEIGHIEDTDNPDKAKRPLPHIPSSHSSERKDKRSA
jgi:hypothetical protein